MNFPGDREGFCIKVFETYLLQNSIDTICVWNRVRGGNDPPDYYLTLGNQKYAVEVTSTSPVIGKSNILQETYESTHIEIVEEIRDEAQKRGILSGIYALGIYDPLTDTDLKFKRIKKIFISEALQIIENLSQQPIGSQRYIEHNYHVMGDIIKVGDEDNDIGHVLDMQTEWTESPQFFTKLTLLLQSPISSKKKKLVEKSEYYPAILLILNTYGLASSQDYKKVVRNISDISFFHTVFLVMGSNGTILFSKEPRWR